MVTQPANLDLNLKRPADLFQCLRSRDIPVEQRIKLAQHHWSNEDFQLQHKQIYFLRWIFEADLYESKKTSKNQSSLSEPKPPSPVQYPAFWEFLDQLVADIHTQDLSVIVGGASSIILLRHALSEWPDLLDDPAWSKRALSSLGVIFPIISQRLSFDVSLELVHGIFERLDNLQSPISASADEMIMLILQGLLPSIQQTSCSRKAFNFLVMNEEVLNRILGILASAHVTPSVKATVLQTIKSLVLSLENLKKIHSSKENQIEWLGAFRHAGRTNPTMSLVASEVVSELLSTLIRDLPDLRSQLFHHHGPLSSNSQSNATDLACLHTSRSFILHVLDCSYEVLRDLGSLTASNLPDCTARLKEIIELIRDCNLYDPVDPSQHQILDRIANDCTHQLSNSSFCVARDSLQILICFLSLDHTLIEVRLAIILEKLIAPLHSSHFLEPIFQFCDGVFDWFSKSKQIPCLFTHLIQISEAKLCEISLQEFSKGPLMDRKFIERFHEEIRLSIPSAQMVAIHELLSTKLRTVLQNLVACQDSQSLEPSRKKRRTSLAKALPLQKDESQEGPTRASDQDANLCVIISVFYEIFIIAASRSPLQPKGWSGLSKKSATFVGELVNKILLPILQRWPPCQSSKNRFRKWKESSEQIVAASTFRVLAATIQAQGCNGFPELEALDLSEWLELPCEVSGRRKVQLNPQLSYELIHLLLEFTSQTVSCLKPVDPIIPRTVYQAILELIDDHAELENSIWNGSVICLTPAQLPCALWHLLTTAHLSDFSNLATREQLDQFTKILFKLGPAAPLQQLHDSHTQKDCFNFFEINQMVFAAPITLECNHLHEPFVQQLLQCFTNIITLDENAASAQSSATQSRRVNYLYETISYLPLSYLTKRARKFLLRWSFLWSDVLALSTLSTEDFLASAIQARSFLFRLLSDSVCVINPEMMKQVVGGTIKFLSYSHPEGDQESLAEVTGRLISVMITRLIQNMKSEVDAEASFELLGQFCLALAEHIRNVVKAISKSKSIKWQHRLIISPLESIAEHAATISARLDRQPRPEDSAFCLRFRQVVLPILNSLEKALKKVRVKGNLTFSNLGLSDLGKIYLRLCRIDESQSRIENCAIDMKSLSSSLKRLNESPIECKLSDCHSFREKAIPKCLELFEEMIEVHRNRRVVEVKGCRQAFKILTMLHLNFRLKKSIQDDDGYNFHQNFKRSFVQSCKKSTPEEAHDALAMILGETSRSCQKFIDSKDCQSTTADTALLTRFQIVIDLGILLILNFPADEDHHVDNLNRCNRLTKGDITLTLLKCLKIIDLRNIDNPDGRDDQKLINFYTWKTDLIEQLCIEKVREIGCSVLVILETLIDLSNRKEFQSNQLLHDRLVSIASLLNQECLRRPLVNHFSLVIKLLVNLMVPKLDLGTYSRLITDLTSTNQFVPPFSKHSPFLLVVLVEKITRVSSRTSSLEGFMNHGLFSLISTMGKFERSSVGRLILETYEQTDDHENSIMNWKKILKDWESFRYKGTD